MAKYCKGDQIYSACSEKDHVTINCNKEKCCLNCKNYNSKFHSNYEITHDMHSKGCMMLEREINNLGNRINYETDK